jgi:hypothetical protein
MLSSHRTGIILTISDEVSVELIQYPIYIYRVKED